VADIFIPHEWSSARAYHVIFAAFFTGQTGQLMNTPAIADNKPIKLALEKDKKYFFCMCGLSARQPFCDGSHQGGDFTPMAFQCDESKDYYLCQCKHSDNKPYCDGSHKRFGDDQVSQDSS